VGERNPGVGRDRIAGADAGNNLEGDARRRNVLGLFAASAEYKRIAPFEPAHLLALPGALDQELVDLLLGQALRSVHPHVDNLGSRLGFEQEFRIRQVVVDHHVGAAQNGRPLERQQPRVSRPCAH